MNAAPPGVTGGPPWTAYGLALLPLCLAGLLPVWGTALLCALFAAGVRWPAWAQGRVLITQLIVTLSMLSLLPAALAGADASGGPAGLVPLALRALLLSLGGLALCAAAAATEEGRRRALLVPLLLGLLAPQAGLLLALVGGALARPGPDTNLRGNARPSVAGARRWWPVMAAGLGALLLALLLPVGNVFTPVAAGTGQSAPPLPPATPERTPAAPAAPGQPPALLRPFQVPVQLNLGSPGVASELILPVALMGLLATLGLFRRTGPARGRPPHPAEVLLLSGLFAMAALWFAAALTLYIQGTGGVTEPAAAASPPPGPQGTPVASAPPAARVLDLSRLTTLLSWGTLLGTALFTAALWWLRRRAYEPQAAPDTDAPPPAPPYVPPEPLHRVREAYRAAQTALSGAGLDRAPAETPAGHAARLTARHPALSGPLATLTAAYEPVRYGGRVTDDDAQQAEQAALALRDLLPTLPDSDLTPRKDTP
ncbi:DUF4129 domain-containing protein [Deinococcus knuensis]|uniref:Protein-glutamine gamma-glutamyltransferase-like C-terminal domain-containing protein n=1 Tax=Deinococcus knuensis TaxID=1837380 RepID=A0ABQ2SEB1_9DEIO|nr:DUF4129 domain-containing protein [Deinococcus knuensis]GGS24621.1 hypothetical protein GCM10008961_15290 [Deinococcus knuensis]